MADKLPLRTRHYPQIKELQNESGQETPAAGMRQRALAMAFLQDYRRHVARPALVPSADHALESVLLSLPYYVLKGRNNPLWNVYSCLMASLPDYTLLVLLVHSRAAPTLQKWLSENRLSHRAQVIKVPDAYDMYIWAEDSYEVVHDQTSGEPCLVQPHSNRRIADDYISHLTAKALGINRVKVPLYFEGGNILVGDDFFLMGADYAVDSLLDLNAVFSLVAEKSGSPLQQITAQYKKYLDRDRHLFLIGSSLIIPEQKQRKFTLNGKKWTETIYTKNHAGTVQPLFHIDMFITLAGRNRAGKYQVLVGDTRLADSLLNTDTARLGLPDVFDDIAWLLQNLGFAVIRNPLPLTYVDDEKTRTRKWYFATSNNALVEVRKNGPKTVWLPTYGHGNWEHLQKTDDENKRIWQELGFTVIQLPDFHPFAEHSGSLHCIKKYLKRGNA